jgi:hypothetical protein
MRFMTWCNKIDERSELLFASARNFGIEVEPIGIGKEYRGGVSKIEWLYEWLCFQPLAHDEILVCTDAHDCIYLRDPRPVPIRTKSITYAGEKWFRKRDPCLQPHFDELAKRHGGDSIYRYPNGGSFVGKVHDVRLLFEDMNCRAMKNDFHRNEQWFLSSACAVQMVDIDYNCDLFWCCAGQWKKARNLARIENGRLTNLTTGGQPFVLHSPIPNRSRAFLTETARKLGVPV